MTACASVAQQLPLLTLEPVAEEAASVHRRWRSRVRPEIVVTDERWDLPVLRWADAHPVVYDVVEPGSRSRAYGFGACSHVGWAQRGPDPAATFERVRTVYGDLHDPLKGLGIFQWRAQFTLAHFGERGFAGGTFCTPTAGGVHGSVLTLDYTPELLDDVALRFAAWADRHRRPVAVVLARGRQEVRRWDWETEILPRLRPAGGEDVSN
jgi:hypothetical protein